jgi:hypothetical protein
MWTVKRAAAPSHDFPTPGRSSDLRSASAPPIHVPTTSDTLREASGKCPRKSPDYIPHTELE